MFGAIDTVSAEETSWAAAEAIAEGFLPAGCSMLSWLAHVDEEDLRRSGSPYDTEDVMGEFLGQLAREGISAIAPLAESLHVLASASLYVSIDALMDDKATILAEVSQDTDSASTASGVAKPEIRGRRAAELVQWGSPAASSIDLESTLDALATAVPQSQRRRYSPSVLFVAELKVPQSAEVPKTLIAQVWNECLGSTAIPFDLAERQELIERGRQHSELRRHIEAWERMSGEQRIPE